MAFDDPEDPADIPTNRIEKAGEVAGRAVQAAASSFRGQAFAIGIILGICLGRLLGL